MIQARRLAALAAAMAIFAGACGGAATSAPSPAASVPSAASPASAAPSQAAPASPAPSLDTTPVTITVWDYYGESTPVKPALAGFQKEYPWITVDYQALDWDSMNEKFRVGVSSGEAPDVATLDMTWIPTLAANGVLEDLTAMSGGQLNGKPITDQYTKGALDAMTFGGSFVTMLFDFDTYALYYRADLLEQKGIAVPTTWDELRAAAKKLAESSKGSGKPDRYLYAIRPNTFHFSQFLFENGGTILNADNTKAAFNSDAGVAAVDIQKAILDDGSGLYWPDANNDLIPAITSGQVAMFSDGPYYMGLLKTGVPAQSGKWKIALAPYSKQPGSYLGGTGLGIPVQAKHKDAAWLFIQYMLRPEQQVGVFTYAGAAPATTAALESPELTKADPYFGGQAPFKVFLDSMATSSHFPYVGAWTEIDTLITDSLQAALLGKATPKAALDDAAAQTDAALAK
jgi:multiple sugar transport system substrate-binding protein